MKKHFKKIKPYRNQLVMLSLIIGMAYILFSSSFHQSVGNLFFGKVPVLYNVTLAQFFFKQSAYPVFGKAPLFAHHQLSRTYFIQGDFDNALYEVKKEIEIYPDNSRAYYILGLTYGYMNQEEKAIGAFSKFIDANPTTWAARNDKAWLQFRTGDIDSALATIEPVTYLISNPWVQNTYGALLMNKKKYPEAKQAFLNAQKMTSMMTEKNWGMAYPGNDPRVYGEGLSAMKISIENNLKILEAK